MANIAPVPPVHNWPAVPQPTLMLVLHPSPSVERVAEAAVTGGVNIVRLRADPAGGEWTDALTESMALRLRGRAVLITCANEAAPMRPIGDGIHLREIDPRSHSDFDVPDLEARLVGRSVHSVDAARHAVELGADYLIAGTVYETASHPGRPGEGIEHLRAICDAVSIPVIAIGGVTPERVADCVGAGAAGVAVMSAIGDAPNARKAAAAFHEALEEAWRSKDHD